MRHTWKETLSGLKRNLAMTIAVVVTMWVSLTLFGIGVLVTQEVELLNRNWSDKIEVSIYLCTKASASARCDPEQAVTDAQKKAIEAALTSNPDVKKIIFEDRHTALKKFQEVYKGTPYQDTLNEDTIAESFRVQLHNPQKFQAVQSAVDGLKGVDAVQDLGKLLRPTFKALNAARWATISASLLLLLAASLQIANTIRMTAFARRRELGIMRLVGAGNIYIMLPFLLESLISALISTFLAGVSLFAFLELVIVQQTQVSMRGLAWVGLKETAISILWVAMVGILLSIIPTLIASRKYLRV